MKEAYCEKCNGLVEVNESKVKMYDKELKVCYNGTKCECAICGTELHENLTDNENSREAERVNKLAKRLRADVMKTESALIRLERGTTDDKNTIGLYSNGNMVYKYISKELFTLLIDELENQEGVQFVP